MIFVAEGPSSKTTTTKEKQSEFVGVAVFTDTTAFVDENLSGRHVHGRG